MNKYTGGSAFPDVNSTGMSLRDWFATHAPTATDTQIIEDIPGFPEFDNSGYFNGRAHPEVREQQRLEQLAWMRSARIKWRWLYADAMIAERDKA